MATIAASHTLSVSSSAVSACRGAGQFRNGDGVPVEHPGGHGVEEGAGHFRTGGCLPRRPGHAPQLIRRAEPAGVYGGAHRGQQDLPGFRGVHLDQRVGGVEQGRAGIAQGVQREGELGPQLGYLGALGRIEWPHVGRGEQCRDLAGRTRPQPFPGGGERPARPRCGVWGEGGGAFEEDRGGGPATARLRPGGSGLQFGGDVLVRAGRGLTAVPSAPVGVAGRVGDLGQGGVHLAELVRIGRPPARRAHQRMEEPDAGTRLDQSLVDRRRGCLRGDPQSCQCPAEQRGVTDRLDRGGEQQGPGVVRQRLDPVPETLLDPPGHGPGPRAAEPEGEFGRGQSARQFPQCQRVAAGLGHDPVPHPVVDRPGQHRVEQCPCVGGGQARHRQLGQSGERLIVTRGQDESHRLGVQPAREKGQHRC